MNRTREATNVAEVADPGATPLTRTASSWMYRFTYTERLLHWTNTISYLVLALTGLGMFFHPLRSAMSVVLAHLPPLFGQSLRLEQVHILAATVFVVGPLLWLVIGNHRALWADA